VLAGSACRSRRSFGIKSIDSPRLTLHSSATLADSRVVKLVQCPYDGADLEAKVTAGGSLLITCPACDAVWETHGAWVGRLREPDRDKMLDERRRADLAAHRHGDVRP
jgi:hypothetical protein